MGIDKIKKNMVCKYCNSDTVLRDAWASWDEDLQDWVLETVFDQGHCGDCDGETTIIEVALETETPQ